MEDKPVEYRKPLRWGELDPHRRENTRVGMWAWLWQRISALAIIVLLALHVTLTYKLVIQFLLLLVVTFHAALGLRVILLDFNLVGGEIPAGVDLGPDGPGTGGRVDHLVLHLLERSAPETSESSGMTPWRRLLSLPSRDSSQSVATTRAISTASCWHIPDETTTTILDVLLRMQREQDPTLAFRFACRVNMCGSCGMVINGKEALACKTNVSHIPPGKEITLRPLNHFPVIKDLVVDMEPFFKKYEEILPFYEPKEEYSSRLRSGPIHRSDRKSRVRHRVHCLRLLRLELHHVPTTTKAMPARQR